MKKLDKRIYSLLDANFGRLNEGLRVLEDIARFILRDLKITKKLKLLRHSFSKKASFFNLQFLNSRGKDIGAKMILKEEKERKDISDLVLANSKRCQEAIRVLEEHFKLFDRKSSVFFQASRFLLYEIEKEIYGKVSKKEKLKKLFPLYLIFDSQYFGKEPLETLKKVISGGITAIQYRDKINPKNKVLRFALRFKKICQQNEVLFLINDFLDITLSVEADGLHLGQEDLPLGSAKKILPFDKIIGISTHNLREAKKTEKEGVDYISVGAVFPTSTKKDVVLINLSEIKKIKKQVSLPLIAIGGINENNLKEVLESGVKGIAISKAIMKAKDPKKKTKEILKKINQYYSFP